MRKRARTGKNFRIIRGPVRTLEDWEAGRRTPPEYIPRLIEYQMNYEKLAKEKKTCNTLEFEGLESRYGKRSKKDTIHAYLSADLVHIEFSEIIDQDEELLPE